MPAAGYRTRETGALTSVGDGGWWWSSSSRAAGEIYAGSLYAGKSYVGPLHYDHRSRGFAVRCVQHLQAAFSR